MISIRVNGGSPICKPKLTSSENFHAYLLEGAGPQLGHTTRLANRNFFISANSNNVLILSNPSSQQISVHLLLTTLSLASQPVVS